MAGAQNRLTQRFRLFYGVEATEGTQVLGTASTCILAENLTLGFDQKILPRQFRGKFGQYQGKAGEQAPMLSFDTELMNHGVTDNLGMLDKLLLTCMGSQQNDAGSSTLQNADSNTTSLDVVSAASFTKGNAVLVETGNLTGIYEMAWISPSWGGASPITLARALTATPTLANGSKVQGTNTYSLKEGGQGSLSFQIYLDPVADAANSDYIGFVGCKGTFSVDITAGQIPKVKWKFDAINWQIGTSVALPASTPTISGLPPVGLSSLFKLDATKTDVAKAMFDMGAKLARKKSVNSTYGTFSQVTSDWKPKGNVTYYDVGIGDATDNTKLNDWTASTLRDLSIAFNNTRFAMTGLRCPFANSTKVAYGDDGGATTNVVDFDGTISLGSDGFFLAMG